MKATLQFIVRQSGWLASFCLLWAFALGAYVCEGLWQGIGLHGYVINSCCTKGGGPLVVAVWAAFIQALTALGLAGVFLVIAIRSGRSERTVRLGFKAQIGAPPVKKKPHFPHPALTGKDRRSRRG